MSVIILQDPECYAEIAEAVTRGGVIAFRTDTFYGLGADPFNRAAVHRIKKLKRREEGKPILIVISDPDQLDRFIAQRTKEFNLLANRFWPGPLTLIGKAGSDVPDEITAGTGTVGVRLPGDEEVRALARACGGALTATSANPSGGEPAKTAAEVGKYFTEGIDLIVDGGGARSDRPSTVLDLSGRTPRVIREGVISGREVEAQLDRR